jgi:hexokinase
MDYSDFNLTLDQLADISEEFRLETEKGLTFEDSRLRCIPAFVDTGGECNGTALVVDIGGTHVRAALVSMKGASHRIEKGPLSTSIPVKRGIPLEKTAYLNVQSALVKRIAPGQGLPLGYCFSYPAMSEPGGDARLLSWTKEISVPGVVGKPVGRLLLDGLKDQGIRCSRAVVVNDTVASLLAGLSCRKAGAHIGLIVGTGTNMAALMDSDLIRSHPTFGFTIPLPVNLESGNFSPPYLTSWDLEMDRDSDNPGKQLFEKAVSGAYLGRILKTVCPDIPHETDIDSKTVSRWAFEAGTCPEKRKKLAGLLLSRSAKLVAASIAGLLSFLCSLKKVESLLITAEGGMIRNSPGYREAVEGTLEDIGKKLGLTVRTEIMETDQANLIGCAFAALSRPLIPAGKRGHGKDQTPIPLGWTL